MPTTASATARARRHHGELPLSAWSWSACAESQVEAGSVAEVVGWRGSDGGMVRVLRRIGSGTALTIGSSEAAVTPP